MDAGPIDVALEIAAKLEKLGIPYVIGGSVASTLWGEPRATLDVDFATQLKPDQVEALVEALGEEFVADVEALRDAAQHHRSCNVIHLRPMMKADLHVRPAEGLYLEEIERARRVVLRIEPRGEAFVASPEDTILQKLRWYVAGGEVSDRQWRDVLGVLKAMAGQLDASYLERWAEELGMTELLRKALEQATHP